MAHVLRGEGAPLDPPHDEDAGSREVVDDRGTGTGLRGGQGVAVLVLPVDGQGRGLGVRHPDDDHPVGEIDPVVAVRDAPGKGLHGDRRRQ